MIFHGALLIRYIHTYIHTYIYFICSINYLNNDIINEQFEGKKLRK